MVRTRFAPSPTGYMHIGNLRTALYAYCFARHNHGTFLLRIEDTDRKRNVPKAVQVIFDSLRLAGLVFDEGPGKDGAHGPYVQSQRVEQGIYQRNAEILLERGAAYRCFCQQPEKEVAAENEPGEMPVRIDPCRFLTSEEVAARVGEGQTFVVRQRIPEEGVTTFHDLVYGDISFKNKQLDDQVLLKSDGFPTYNFANVVDDHLMEITHVLRGVEYLSSTPKYNLLYESFGWEIPQYVHLPHIVNESGKKLSKRAGDASFQDLIARGFLPQAIVNAIALLGWSPGNDREFFTLDELVQEFDIQRINKSPAAFSMSKLEWLNGEHLRSMTLEEFHQVAKAFYPAEIRKRFDTRLISKVIQLRVARLTDIPETIGFLLAPAPYSVELFEHAKSKSTIQSSLEVLQAAIPQLAEIQEWTEPAVRQVMMDLAASTNRKTGTVMWPVRVALSGLLTTPGGATEIAAILGKEESLDRLQAAVDLIQASPRPS